MSDKLEKIKKDSYFCKKIAEYKKLNEKIELLESKIGSGDVGVYKEHEEITKKRNEIETYIAEMVVTKLFDDIK